MKQVLQYPDGSSDGLNPNTFVVLDNLVRLNYELSVQLDDVFFDDPDYQTPFFETMHQLHSVSELMLTKAKQQWPEELEFVKKKIEEDEGYPLR